MLSATLASTVSGCSGAVYGQICGQNRLLTAADTLLGGRRLWFGDCSLDWGISQVAFCGQDLGCYKQRREV